MIQFLFIAFGYMPVERCSNFHVLSIIFSVVLTCAYKVNCKHISAKLEKKKKKKRKEVGGKKGGRENCAEDCYVLIIVCLKYIKSASFWLIQYWNINKLFPRNAYYETSKLGFQRNCTTINVPSNYFLSTNILSILIHIFIF